MHTNHSAAWRLLLVIMTAYFIGIHAHAEENTPQQDPKADSAEEKNVDIWNEFSFTSKEDLQLTEKQIQEILDQLKKTDPAKAEQLEKLKREKAEEFIAAIREVIKQQQNKSVSEQPEQIKWKEELFKKHEAFLAWLKNQYPEDHKELIELQIEEPEKYVQRFMDLIKLYEPIQKMERYNPKLSSAMKKNLDLQKRRDTLLLQIRISSETEQPKLIEELHHVVSERFDTIVFEKQLQYEWLRNRLDALTKKVEERAKELESLNNNKEQCVKDRMDELMERTAKVNWD